MLTNVTEIRIALPIINALVKPCGNQCYNYSIMECTCDRPGPAIEFYRHLAIFFENRIKVSENKFLAFSSGNFLRSS